MFKVIPFMGYISYHGNPQHVSSELEQIINAEASNGWVFIQIQELTTTKAGSSGCFGIGREDPHAISLAVLIFRHL